MAFGKVATVADAADCALYTLSLTLGITLVQYGQTRLEGPFALNLLKIVCIFNTKLYKLPKVSKSVSSGSSSRVRGGRETWNLCGRGHLFYDLFSQGRGGHGPPRPPPDPLLSVDKYIQTNRKIPSAAMLYCHSMCWISGNATNTLVPKTFPFNWTLTFNI